MGGADIPGKQGAQPACAGTDTAAWFPASSAASNSAATTAAKRICGGCELRAACLQWALRHEKHGVWAGTTDSERRRMRREQGIEFIPLTYSDLYGRADKGTTREDDAA